MIIPLTAIQTKQGTVYVKQSSLGGPDVATIISSGAGAGVSLISSGFAATLFTSAAAAQALPIVGQVLGAIALVSGLIAKSKAKANAIKEQSAQVDVANAELIAANAELDLQILTAQAEIGKIKTELAKLGLGGFADWLKKTFTPGAYQTDIYTQKVAENEDLQKRMQQKIATLEATVKELETLYNKLTGEDQLQKILLWGGGAVVGISALYLISKLF